MGECDRLLVSGATGVKLLIARLVPVGAGWAVEFFHLHAGGLLLRLIGQAFVANGIERRSVRAIRWAGWHALPGAGVECLSRLALLLLILPLQVGWLSVCLLYTSPSPRDRTRSRMPSSA